MEINVRRGGVMAEATPEAQHGAKQRFEELLEYAKKSESHLWTAIVAYHLSDDAIQRRHTDGIHLDLENMTGLPHLGCYICEVPYEDRLLRRRCPGEPKE